MIEFLIAKIARRAVHDHAARRHRGERDRLYAVMPLFAGEGLAKRMKAVASERERLRQRERDRLAKSGKGVAAADARSSSCPRWWKIST